MKSLILAAFAASSTAKIRATAGILLVMSIVAIAIRPDMFATIPAFVGLWWEQSPGTVPANAWLVMLGFPALLLAVISLSVGVLVRSYGGWRPEVSGLYWSSVTLWLLLRGGDHIIDQFVWLVVASMIASGIMVVWQYWPRPHRRNPRHHGRSSFEHCEPDA